MTTKAALAREEKAEAIGRLRDILKPGDTVYTVLRHVSSSGMTRDIDVYVIKDNKPLYITGLVGKACGYSRSNLNNNGLRVTGVGMDMGFAVVHDLAHTLYPDGFHCTGISDYDSLRCPSNDHANERSATEGFDVTRVHSSGGYALRQEWI